MYQDFTEDSKEQNKQLKNVMSCSESQHQRNFPSIVLAIRTGCISLKTEAAESDALTIPHSEMQSRRHRAGRSASEG